MKNIKILVISIFVLSVSSPSYALFGWDDALIAIGSSIIGNIAKGTIDTASGAITGAGDLWKQGTQLVKDTTGWIDSEARKQGETDAWKNIATTVETSQKALEQYNKLNDQFNDFQNSIDNINREKDRVLGLINKGDYSGAYYAMNDLGQDFSQLANNGDMVFFYSNSLLSKLKNLYETNPVLAIKALEDAGGYRADDDFENKIEEAKEDEEIDRNKAKTLVDNVNKYFDSVIDPSSIDAKNTSLGFKAPTTIREAGNMYQAKRANLMKYRTSRYQELYERQHKLKVRQLELGALIQKIKNGDGNGDSKFADKVNHLFKAAKVFLNDLANDTDNVRIKLDIKNFFSNTWLNTNSLKDKHKKLLKSLSENKNNLDKESDNIDQDISFELFRLKAVEKKMDELKTFSYTPGFWFFKSKPVEDKTLDEPITNYRTKWWDPQYRGVMDDYKAIKDSLKEMEDNHQKLIDCEKEFDNIQNNHNKNMSAIDNYYKTLLMNEYDKWMGNKVKKVEKTMPELIRELNVGKQQMGFR